MRLSRRSIVLVLVSLGLIAACQTSQRKSTARKKPKPVPLATQCAEIHQKVSHLSQDRQKLRAEESRSTNPPSGEANNADNPFDGLNASIDAESNGESLAQGKARQDQKRSHVDETLLVLDEELRMLETSFERKCRKKGFSHLDFERKSRRTEADVKLFDDTEMPVVAPAHKTGIIKE